MAQQRKKKQPKTSDLLSEVKDVATKSSTSYDPTLANLFATSLGPTKTAPEHAGEPKSTIGKSLRSGALQSTRQQGSDSEPTLDDQDAASIVVGSDSNGGGEIETQEASPQHNRKRKRKQTDDDVEGMYMQKLAREEAREDAKRRRKQKPEEAPTSPHNEKGTDMREEVESELDNVGIVTGDERDSSPAYAPQHESLGPTKADSDLEKASQTVFLGNVSTAAIKSKSGKKILLDHLASFLSSLPKQDILHRVESLRFRSTAFSSSAVPKKAAFAKKELMDSTTQSTNAYAVYSTQLAAREATKRLNGSIVLDRHLRVDSIAHPAKTDHQRCVFVGNLGFVDDESATKAAEDEANGRRPRKGKEPADLEEGLWKQFGKAGAIESVRVPRDKTTRVGKGFAYVQFEDPNGVEKALLFDGKKFPPLLPRILRVVRAKNIQKTSGRQDGKPSARTNSSQGASSTYRPKIPSKVQSMTGRAEKLLGRAGAAQSRGHSGHGKKPIGVPKTPESVVFEGYRASSKQGKGTLKLGGSGKKQGKPRTRSSKRGAAFKASGRKK